MLFQRILKTIQDKSLEDRFLKLSPEGAALVEKRLEQKEAHAAYYALLELSDTATRDEVSQSFRRLNSAIGKMVKNEGESDADFQARQSAATEKKEQLKLAHAELYKAFSGGY